MEQVAQNRVIELNFESAIANKSPDDVQFDVIVTYPDGKKAQVPGYWAGDNNWCVRLSSAIIGVHSYSTKCSNDSDLGLHDQTGQFEVCSASESNLLYLHGHLQVSDNRKYLEHADKTPFFWLGDTWWMGFTDRLHWPDEFQLLTEDRVQKGFTLVQIVAGLYPDMAPFDPRGKNEGGYPWQDQKFEHINPEYFDFVDRRVQYLVGSGLALCLVGSWGYFLDVMGIEALKKHWRYLVARYGAYPVVWCIAGEATMRFYLDKRNPKVSEKQDFARRTAAWSEVTATVRALDAFHNPITIHPTKYAHTQLDRPELLDVDMLQTGHANPASEIAVIKNTVKMVGIARKHKMPVVVGEVSYEGILEANRQQVQRCLFWANILSGGAGHTYGANGIWQLNRRDQSYGVSPHGSGWGETAWEDAYQLLGSAHVGLDKGILSKYPWWQLEPHPEWVQGNLAFAAGISSQLRIIYRLLPGRFTIRKLERNVKYTATLIDPKNGKQYPFGLVNTEKNGTWRVPNPHIMQDWILILECN